MKIFKILLPLLLALPLYATAAEPILSGQGSQATATIPSRCTFTAGGSLNFGTYAPFSLNETTDKEATTTVKVRCTAGTTGAMLYMDKGLWDLGSCTGTPARRMGPLLKYDIYQDSARTIKWGCEATNAYALADFVSSTDEQIINVFATIPAGQKSAISGTHTDTVTVSVVL